MDPMVKYDPVATLLYREQAAAAALPDVTSVTSSDRPVLSAGMNLRSSGVLDGETYGSTHYNLYEACGPDQAGQNPLLFVWLHGADDGDIPATFLSTMHGRLRRITFFLSQ